MTKEPGIRIKRAYEPPSTSDGKRFLVDRLWPRGKKKEDLQLEAWIKDAAPSNSLRKQFGHREGRWEDFCRKYFAELDQNPEAWQPLLEAARKHTITLVYAARDEERNNAVALKQYLSKKL